MKSWLYFEEIFVISHHFRKKRNWTKFAALLSIESLGNWKTLLESDKEFLFSSKAKFKIGWNTTFSDFSNKQEINVMFLNVAKQVTKASAPHHR